jgi:exodeoxyribonuclease VII large subunit
MIVPNRSVLLHKLEEMRRTIRDATVGRFVTERSTLADLLERIDSSKLSRKLDQMHQQTADFAERIMTAPLRKISFERELCKALGEMITKSAKTRIATTRLKLLAQKEIVLGRDPYKPLKLGYSLLWREGVVIRSAKNISTGDCLTLQLSNGKAIAIVESVTYDRDT